MGILKTVDLADFAEKNAKRIRILKTVGLADFAEKNTKRMGIECLKNENSNVVVRKSELKPLQCNVLLLCPGRYRYSLYLPGYANPKRTESAKCHCFSNVFENFHSRNDALCCDLRSLPASGAGFRSLGSLPFSEEPKRIRQKSVGSLPKKE